jgi:hypothetical protein
MATPLLTLGSVGTGVGAAVNLVADAIEMIENKKMLNKLEGALETQRSYVENCKEILNLLATKDGSKLLFAAYQLQRMHTPGIDCVGRFLDFCYKRPATPMASTMVWHYREAHRSCSTSRLMAKVLGGSEVFVQIDGALVAGVGAVFLVWDVIDLGTCIYDLVKKKGSEVGNILREKARELESSIQSQCCGNCR